MTNQPTNFPNPNGGSGFNSQGDQEEVLIRRRKRRKKKHKKLMVTGIVVVALAAVIGGGAFAVNSMINSGQQNIKNANAEAAVDTAENAVTYDEGKTVEYNGHHYQLKDSMVSVLMIGYDREAPAEEGEKAGQSDALVVMALDTDTGQATAISIPRDSMVLVDQYRNGSFAGSQTQQICLAYAYGDGGTFSSEITSKAVSRVLYNIPISYYFSIDLAGIGPINDSIGGVSLTPLQSIPNTIIYEGVDTTLFGTNARSYVQWRDTSIDGSALDRQERQIQYVKAFASQALSAAKGNVGTLIDIYNTASDYSITNLGLEEFSYLATKVAGSGLTDLSITSLAGTNTQGTEHEEFILDTAAVYQTVLSTYYKQID